MPKTKIAIIPTGTTCNINSNGWNYFYFGHSFWDRLVVNRESERIIVNEQEYKIITQHIIIPNIKNKQIRRDDSSYPTFDEYKALKLAEEAIEKGEAIIESFSTTMPLYKLATAS
jgi:hypothetical protein